MTLRDIIKSTQKVAVDNSPAILTAIGVTGALTTAYLTGKASFKAAQIIADEQFQLNLHNKSHKLEPKEKFALIWKLYIPAVTTGVFTCTAIVCANQIGARRTAAITAAYSLSEKAFVEYKEKVLEKIGENKEQAVRDEIAQDHVKAHPPKDSQIILTGKGDVLCRDEFSGRYFRSSMELLRKAQNDINYQILHSDYATVNNFYSNINLEQTSGGEEMGWNTDKQLELSFSATLTEDDEPCMVVSFGTVPIRDPWRFC